MYNKTNNVNDILYDTVYYQISNQSIDTLYIQSSIISTGQCDSVKVGIETSFFDNKLYISLEFIVLNI